MENVKAKAWEFLTKYQLGELPMDILSLNAKNVGFKIMSYDEGKEFINIIGKTEYSKKHKGFAINYHGNNYIFYDNKLAYSEKSSVIAHEIGHIVLQHTMNDSNIYGKSDDKETESFQEKEADIFSLALLSPAPVLLEMKVFSPDVISRITGLPFELSRNVSIEIIKEESIKKTGIEEKLIDTFRESIYKYRGYKNPPESIHTITPELYMNNKKKIPYYSRQSDSMLYDYSNISYLYIP